MDERDVWVEGLEPENVRKLQSVLREIKTAMERTGKSRVAISPVFKSTLPFFGREGLRGETTERLELASTLKRHGVLANVELRREGGSSYLVGEEAIIVEGDLEIVGRVLRAMTDRIERRFRSPTTPPPPAEDPIDHEVRRIHRTERAKLPYALILLFAGGIVGYLVKGGCDRIRDSKPAHDSTVDTLQQDN